MKKRNILILAFLAVIIFGSSIAFTKEPPAKVYRYKVIKIQDGDTFTATDGNLKFRVRIVGMDAPEKRQPYGKVASHRLSEMILNKDVEITSVGRGMDRYGRILGIVSLGGENIAINLIKQGLATYYRPTCQDYPLGQKKYNYDPELYLKAESQARKEKLNIWKTQVFIYPCKYRKMKK